MFQGDTIYSPYLSNNVPQNPFPGNSLKVLFNSTISSSKNTSLGTPGIYNGVETNWLVTIILLDGIHIKLL